MKQENKKLKIIKRLLLAILIIMFICIIATFGVGNYFVNYAIFSKYNFLIHNAE